MNKLRCELVRRQLVMLHEIFKCFPADTKVSRPSGGYFLWIELPAQIDAMMLYERSMEKGISIAPGPLFSARGQYANYIRLNYGLSIDSIRNSIKALGALARSLM